MSLQLGAVHAALGFAGAWAGRRRRAIAAAAAAWLVLVLLVLDAASPLWRHAGPLRFLQFPWRLLAATATLQLAAAMGLRAWTQRLPARAEAALLAGLALVALGWHADQFAIAGATGDPVAILRDYHARVKRTSFEHFAYRDEFTPRTARRRPAAPRDADAPPVVLEGPGRVTSLPGASPQRVLVRIEAPAATAARVEQLYLPGWELRLDGEAIDAARLEASLTPEGFARVAVGPGAHRLEASYGGPPGAGARALGVLAALLPFAALLRRPRATGSRGALAARPLDDVEVRRAVGIREARELAPRELAALRRRDQPEIARQQRHRLARRGEVDALRDELLRDGEPGVDARGVDAAEVEREGVDPDDPSREHAARVLPAAPRDLAQRGLEARLPRRRRARTVLAVVVAREGDRLGERSERERRRRERGRALRAPASATSPSAPVSSSAGSAAIARIACGASIARLAGTGQIASHQSSSRLAGSRRRRTRVTPPATSSGARKSGQAPKRAGWWRGFASPSRKRKRGERCAA